MNKNEKNIPSHHQNKQMLEFGLQDLFQIIYRRKNTILLSIIAPLILVIIYNFFSNPVYESTVTIKKELQSKRGANDEFRDMILMQTMDELDTEIELIKTWTVLEKVVKELKIYVNIRKVEFSDGDGIDFDELLIVFNERIRTGENNRLPQFSNFNTDIENSSVSKEYYVEIIQANLYKLYDEETDQVIQSAQYDSTAVFNITGLHFELKWPDGKIGDKVYLTINNFDSSVISLQKKVAITKIGKSNIFKVSFRSESPMLAKMIVTAIVEKYRDYRLTVKRQETHNLFLFVDNQLNEISEKLMNAEIELSQFKSETEIFDIDASSTEVVKFLGNLESEKIKVDIELVELRSNLEEMKAEQKKKGYFNQTYLAPEGEGGARSPFSILLEQLTNAEINRIELLQKRREDHPDIITLNDQIAQIKIGLAEYNDNTIISIQIMINTLTKKQNIVASKIRKYTNRLKNLPTQETTYIQLTRKKNSFEKMYTMLLDKREELRLAELSKLQDIDIIDPARLPLKPIFPKKILNILLGLIVGLILGIVTIFIQEYSEKKITNIEEIEKQFSSQILAVIPEYTKELNTIISEADIIEDRLVSLMDDHKEYLESYRSLRTRLFGLKKKDNGLFIITSSEANTGKSTIVANLGVSLARTGKKVLLIDGDLKKAGLSQLFNVPKDFPDIKEYLRKEGSVPVLFRPFADIDVDLDIDILSAGKGEIEDSSELLELDKMKTLFKFAASKYNYVLIDSPPVTKLVDTLIIGKYVQDIIFVVRQKHSFKEEIMFGFEEIKQLSLNVAGIVINASDLNKSSYKYRYGYY